MDYKISIIPVFIRAKSPEELVQKMMMTNEANQKKYNYMNPIKDGKGWVVWYYADPFTDKHIDGLKPADPLEGL